jgi:hypothetical protein
VWYPINLDRSSVQVKNYSVQVFGPCCTLNQLGPNHGPKKFQLGPKHGPNNFQLGPKHGPNNFQLGPKHGPNKFQLGPNNFSTWTE